MLKKTLMTAAAALAITVGATTISTPDANAETKHNANIKVSESELEKKCKSSGGEMTYNTEGGGGYDCLVLRDAGAYSYVSCNMYEECEGHNFDGKYTGWTSKRVPSRDLLGKQQTVKFSSPKRKKTQMMKTQMMKISRSSLMKISRSSLMARRRAK